MNSEATGMVQGKYLTVAQLLKHLQIHRNTIYQLLLQRKLPGFRVGRDWRFSLEAIEQWQRDHQMKTEARRPHVLISYHSTAQMLVSQEWSSC
jgi:excisionase family DNA binding protein